MGMAVPATVYSCWALLWTGEERRRHPKGFPQLLGQLRGQQWLVTSVGETAWGSAHLRFHPPAAASHNAGDDQQREPCGRDEAADEHLPTHGQGNSPAQNASVKSQNCVMHNFSQRIFKVPSLLGEEIGALHPAPLGGIAPDRGTNLARL